MAKQHIGQTSLFYVVCYIAVANNIFFYMSKIYKNVKISQCCDFVDMNIYENYGIPNIMNFSVDADTSSILQIQ